MAKELDIVQNAGAAQMETPATQPGETLASADRSGWLQQPTIDKADIYIPRLKLGQATTAEVVAGSARPGNWVVQGYDGFQSIIIVPLSYKKKWRRIVVHPNKPVACYDHTSGDTNVDCPNCRWQNDPKLAQGGWESVINPVHLYQVYVQEIDGAAEVEFTGTSETAGKMLLGLVMSKGLGNFAVRLASTLSKGQKGQWYVAAIQGLPEVPHDLIATVREFATA